MRGRRDNPPESGQPDRSMARRSAFTPYQGGATVNSPPVNSLPYRSTKQRAMTLATAHLLELYQVTSPDFVYNPRSNPRRNLTWPDEGVGNDGYDNSEHDYILCVNDVLESRQGDQYLVVDMLGTGTFGQVVKCQHIGTNKMVAVKVIKNQPAYSRQAQTEVLILRHIHRKNSEEDVQHVVTLFADFTFRSHLCLVFELLSINLFEMIKQQNYRGISLVHLRSFVQQILQALVVLAKSGVIHCDLKPENILLGKLDATDIKIIDFGSACWEDRVNYTYVQSRFYRSPEVLLSMDYNSKIDVWSLGCIAGELFLGLPLFPGSSEQNMVYRIVEMLSPPTARMLTKCNKAQTYFNVSTDNGEAKYELKSEAQYAAEWQVEVPAWKRYFPQVKLKEIVMRYPFPPNPPQHEVAMRECFADFLAGLLQIDPEDRWTPAEAMSHPFVNGKVLEQGQPWKCPRQRDVNSHSSPNVEATMAPADAGYSSQLLGATPTTHPAPPATLSHQPTTRGAAAPTEPTWTQQAQTTSTGTGAGSAFAGGVEGAAPKAAASNSSSCDPMKAAGVATPQTLPSGETVPKATTSNVVMPRNMRSKGLNTHREFKFGSYSPSPVPSNTVQNPAGTGENDGSSP